MVKTSIFFVFCVIFCFVSTSSVLYFFCVSCLSLNLISLGFRICRQGRDMRHAEFTSLQVKPRVWWGDRNILMVHFRILLTQTEQSLKLFPTLTAALSPPQIYLSVSGFCTSVHLASTLSATGPI